MGARLGALCLAGALMSMPAPGQTLDLDRADGALRVATFNASLVRKGAGVLIADIDKADRQILTVAEIVLHVRPDILLINEIDFDPQGLALNRFADLLAAGTGDLPGLDYPHRYTAPSNTGVPSGFDLDGDGRVADARDALGYGRFPGQYGMAVLSRHPIGPVRTFRNLKWAAIPWAQAPQNPDGTPFYADAAWAALPLSSKSHWDVAVTLPDGRALHLLASHPTPPVFDGPENRNGLRNAAEVRFWIDYLSGADWMVDDAGQAGGLGAGAVAIVMGDLNADPLKGDGDQATITALISHPRLQDPRPESPGAAAAGDAANTADWPEEDGPGDLRVDYVLPDARLVVLGSGVFWPAPDDPLARLTAQRGKRPASSDHRLVWVDVDMNADMNADSDPGGKTDGKSDGKSDGERP
ncbi:MAG: endonuclease/exonuclease/phosphatase family protein [Pseudomonadota bacterium]